MSATPQLTLEQEGESCRVIVGGSWSLRGKVPRYAGLHQQLSTVRRVRLEAHSLEEWDSSLATLLKALLDDCRARDVTVEMDGLPEGLRRLLALASAVVPRTGRRDEPHRGYVAGIGAAAIKLWHDLPAMVEFAGEIALSIGRLCTGRARFSRQDLWLFIEDAGARALPIVSLISFLVGLILAYMGALQLALFGAEIYIADLVAVGVVREIAALMTGIILAGRTGAAYAAQLGTMQVNEEIDAFRTLGISPIDYLVLPRVLALVAMVPLLTLYAALVGMLAGMLVAQFVFHVGFHEYYNETVNILNLQHLWAGLIKGTVYGAMVAYAGCLRGMQCGRSAQAVGEATTSAVVLGILLITISASLLTILFQKIGL